MKFFSLIKGGNISIAPKKKIIPAQEFSQLLSSSEVMEKVQEEALDYRSDVVSECETLKEQAEAAGFDEGLKQWNEQIIFLQNEITHVRKEMENSLVPLAMTAVKRILGKEIETKPETIVDIVATALKAVSQHQRVTIYVRRSDVDILEENRPRIKGIFEHLQTLTISSREDIAPGGCIIETEVGIINAQLETQLTALETAFQTFFQSQKKT